VATPEKADINWDALTKDRRSWRLQFVVALHAITLRNLPGQLGVTGQSVKNCTLKKGRGLYKGRPEWSQFPIS